MRYKILILSAFMFLGSFLMTSLSYKGQSAAVPEFKKTFTNYTQDFSSKFLRLESAIAGLNNTKGSADSLKKIFQETRYSYKKLELILEYYYPRMALDINSPLVTKADEYDKEKIRVPEGLQVIEQYVYSEKPFEEKANMLVEIRKTKPLLKNLNTENQIFNTTDAHIFEMMRFQLIRIITLGINGFDATVSLDGLTEATYSLEAINEAVQLYKNSDQKKAVGIVNRITKNITTAKQYLITHNDFNTFDRLYFIRTYANPLADDLLLLQETLQIERLKFITALDLSKKNIFAKNAFNLDFFSQNQRDTFHRREQITLGQILFFDPVFSDNNKRSCASCHVPGKAFTDGLSRSVAFDFKGNLDRNAPTLVNAALQRRFFHDGRAVLMENQIVDVVHNAAEMHSNIEAVVVKLKKSKEYKELFRKAFAGKSDTMITSEAIRKCIAEYEKTLVAMNSRFDRYMRGENTLSPSEINGYNLFAGKAKCGTCHFTPLFNGTVPPMFMDSELEVIGVPKDKSEKELDTDYGRFHFTNIELQRGSFKTPTLRNVELTGPYMHNGVYTTLEEVIEFYNKGGGQNLGYEVPNQTLPFNHLNLLDQEKKDLISFMKALTDTTGTTSIPTRLPAFPEETGWNSRKTGGEY